MKERLVKLMRIVAGTAGVIGWAALCLSIRTQTRPAAQPCMQ